MQASAKSRGEGAPSVSRHLRTGWGEMWEQLWLPRGARCGPSMGQQPPPWPGSRTIWSERAVNEEEGKTNDASSK